MAVVEDVRNLIGRTAGLAHHRDVARPVEVAMTKRRDPAASQDDDEPKLISLQDKHEADRLLQQALAAGEIDQEEFKRRRGRAYAAVTPRELWKATGHRAGSRERADKALIWRSVRLQLAIVAFAVVIMMFVLLGTIINNQGGTVDTPVFPWEWGD
jgi:uncharacterized membrane protein